MKRVVFSRDLRLVFYFLAVIIIVASSFSLGADSNVVGDLTGDLCIDSDDLFIFAQAMPSALGDINYEQSCDFNHDNRVDYLDMSIFSQNWKWQDKENRIYITRDMSVWYSSLQDAVDASLDGDIIVLTRGEYLGTSATPSDYRKLTIRSVNPLDFSCVENTILRAPNANVIEINKCDLDIEGLSFLDSNTGALLIQKSKVDIKRCNFENNTAGMSTRSYPNNLEVILSDCHISGNYNGIYMPKGGFLDIYNCDISDNSWYGINCGVNLFIKNSRIQRNQGIGLRGIIHAQNCLVSGNGCRSTYSSSYRGIIAVAAQDGKSTYLRNSTVVNNKHYGIDGSIDSIENCIIWNNGSRSSYGDLYNYHGDILYSCLESTLVKGSSTYVYNTGVAILSDAPNFVDINSDYHLRSDSLCIDAASPWSDFSNEPVPNGGRANIGYYGNTDQAAVSIDTDNDSLLDAWELKYFSSLAYSASDGCGPDNPLDGDNFDNLSEYLYGYDPCAFTDVDAKIFRITTDNPDFDPTENQSVTVEYWSNLSSSATVKIESLKTGLILLDSRINISSGKNTYSWDGRDSSGLIALRGDYKITLTLDSSQVSSAIDCHLDYENMITDVICNPYRIITSYGECSRVYYRSNTDAQVVVEFIDPSNNIVSSINAQAIVGSNSCLWYGRDFNNHLPTLQGLYNVRVRFSGMQESLTTQIGVYN